MNHVRDALLDDRTDADVAAHLEACPSCRSFATALGHIRETAPTLVGSAPPDLADRVLAGLDLGEAPVRADRDRGRGDRVAFLPAFLAGTGRRLTAMAAALLLIVGLAVVLQNGGPDDPREVVLASAERTVAEGTARIAVEADAEVVVDVPDVGEGEVPPAPDLSHVPAEMHAHVHREWARIMADFQVQLEEFQREVDATMEEAHRQIAEAQRQIDQALREMQEAFGSGYGSWEGGSTPHPPQPPAAPAPPEQPGTPDQASGEAPPTLPTSLSTRVTVQASGSVAFGQRLRLEGRARPEATVASSDAERFGLAVDGDTAAYLGPDGAWTGLPGAAGPLGGVLLDADAVARVLSSPQGEVEAVGEARIDGETVRRYRFTVDGATIARSAVTAGSGVAAGASWTAEAWIDDDGRTRRLELSSDGLAEPGTGTVWRTRIGLHLSDFGTGAPEGAPTVTGRAQLPASASLLLYPFGPNISASTGATAEVDG